MRKGKKQIRLAAKVGQGVPPGYAWNIFKLTVADRDAEAFLNARQYLHLRDQVRELAREKNPALSRVVSVDQIEDF